MKNKEKFKDEIIDIVCEGHTLTLSHGKPEGCELINCSRCDLSPCGRDGGGRKEGMKKWAEQEYDPIKEVDWRKVKVDTKVLVKNSEEEKWQPRYFAKYENGRIYAWRNGATSWSTSRVVAPWSYAKLATPIECIKSCSASELCKASPEKTDEIEPVWGKVLLDIPIKDDANWKDVYQMIENLFFML